MEFNKKLYYELYHLREKFKDEGRWRVGRAPTVCTDAALEEMVRLLPQKKEDFLAIADLGNTFYGNYGDAFLEVILKHAQTENEIGIPMSSGIAATLKELEKKLISINRRNRLLYMPKLTNKYAFDLFETPLRNRLVDFLSGKLKRVALCDSREASGPRGQTGADKYRKLVQLIREVNKDLREKGQYDLFIGYPFVEGRIAGENFDIKAPLALFPVILDRDAQFISVRLDETRDIVLNNTLILAHQKFNNVSNPLPNAVLDEYSPATFSEQLAAFYRESGIHLMEDSGAEMLKFSEYLAGEFPNYGYGELHVVPNLVIGKYPTYSSSIQKDFDAILEKNEINALLYDLLVALDTAPAGDDAIYGERDRIEPVEILSLKEHDLVYINELNSAQENVLHAIQHMDELVVQGPPGTGKSQTITNLIAEFACQGKTVLMISEKKTALDVVYSRLGTLSDYTLLIDDVGNKDLFYEQLSRMLHLGGCRNPEQDLQQVSQSIDAEVALLERIAQKLYTPDEFGIEPYKLYIENHRIDLSNPACLERYKAVRAYANDALLQLRYPELSAIHRLYSDRILTRNLNEYRVIEECAPWIADIRGNLTEYALIEFDEKLAKLESDFAVWQSKSWIVRIFTKHKLLESAGMLADEFLTKHEKSTSAFLLENCAEVRSSLSSYNTYIERKPLYDRLTNHERIYFNSLYELEKQLNSSLVACNAELYNQLVFERITNFETKNRELLGNLDSFDHVIFNLSQAIQQKRELTRRELARVLAESMQNITFSKRSGEIARVTESRRKWSVSKFISKFDFELFRGVKVWLLTPEVVSEIIPLQTGLFDLVIFDEASQMYIEKGVPAILRAKKVVIAGDHKQLRPSKLGAGRIETDDDLTEEEAEDSSAALEEESLLDLARFRYQDVLLNFHYRSRFEELIAFSNYAFYKGRLYVSPNTTQMQHPPIQVLHVDDARWVNRSNQKEAETIVKMLKHFFTVRKNNETIGIITFNSSQRDLIEDLIDAESVKDATFAAAVKAEISRTDNGEDIGLFVKNIESVQGDERDVIMFSIGYAKNEAGRLVRNYGWLNQKGGENRLNVAITRAKKKVLIVTSFDANELQVEDAKNDGPRILKKYLLYAQAINDSDKAAAQSILLSFGDAERRADNVVFDSDFENQVYDELSKCGYQVETQVGIGGYSIDLAIKRDGKFILGVECDGKLYHSSKSARERDYHRQKYLESRGWRIHRIWSSNWWKNPKTEIAKIRSLVDSL